MGLKKALTRKDLGYRCAELRRRGLSPYEIGKELGLSDTKAAKLVDYGLARQEALSRYKSETLSLELQRLDEMQYAIYGQAIGDEMRVITNEDGRTIAIREPNTEGIKTVLLIMKRRDALLGLDAPVSKVVEVTGKDGGPLTVSMIDACLRAPQPANATHQIIPALPEAAVDAEFEDLD